MYPQFPISALARRHRTHNNSSSSDPTNKDSAAYVCTTCTCECSRALHDRLSAQQTCNTAVVYNTPLFFAVVILVRQQTGPSSVPVKIYTTEYSVYTKHQTFAVYEKFEMPFVPGTRGATVTGSCGWQEKKCGCTCMIRSTSYITAVTQRNLQRMHACRACFLVIMKDYLFEARQW